MQTVGLIGGIAPGSTIDYYRLLIDGYRARRADGSYPAILIDSIDLQKFLNLVESGDRTRLADYLLVEIKKLRVPGPISACSRPIPHT